MRFCEWRVELDVDSIVMVTLLTCFCFDHKEIVDYSMRFCVKWVQEIHFDWCARKFLLLCTWSGQIGFLVLCCAMYVYLRSPVFYGLVFCWSIMKYRSFMCFYIWVSRGVPRFLWQIIGCGYASEKMEERVAFSNITECEIIRG